MSLPVWPRYCTVITFSPLPSGKYNKDVEIHRLTCFFYVCASYRCFKWTKPDSAFLLIDCSSSRVSLFPPHHVSGQEWIPNHGWGQPTSQQCLWTPSARFRHAPSQLQPSPRGTVSTSSRVWTARLPPGRPRFRTGPLPSDALPSDALPTGTLPPGALSAGTRTARLSRRPYRWVVRTKDVRHFMNRIFSF